MKTYYLTYMWFGKTKVVKVEAECEAEAESKGARIIKEKYGFTPLFSNYRKEVPT